MLRKPYLLATWAFAQVQLADDGSALVVASQLLYYRGHQAAGAAPLGPKIYEHWLIRFDKLFEIGVSYFNCFACHVI